MGYLYLRARHVRILSRCTRSEGNASSSEHFPLAAYPEASVAPLLAFPRLLQA